MHLAGHLASWSGHKMSCELLSGTWLFCFQHVLVTWPFASCLLASQSQTSRKVHCSSQFFTKHSHSTLTLNHTNIQGNDWLNTIKFNTELKPTNHNWKLQLYTKCRKKKIKHYNIKSVAKGTSLSLSLYIYIYIERERERERIQSNN